MPETDALQVRVEVPEPPEMEVELNVHDRLVELVVTTRVTVPVKPLTGLIVIVDAPAAPAFRVKLVGLAEIVKSGTAVGITWYVTAAAWDRPLFVPVTVAR